MMNGSSVIVSLSWVKVFSKGTDNVLFRLRFKVNMDQIGPFFTF